MSNTSNCWHIAGKVTTGLFTLLVLAAVAQAQPITCFPPPIDTCGKGPVHGITDGVEWTAWWIEANFEWQRVHWYFLLNGPATLPVPGAGSASGHGSAASAAYAASGTMRSCNVSPHREALAACRAMTLASDRTMPPAILYNVDRPTKNEGTRPGHRLMPGGALVTDGLRHRAGAWCECWRGAVKAGTTQYCLVTKTASYAACRRVQ